MNKLINKYQIFIKYVFSSGFSFLLDLTLFSLFLLVFCSSNHKIIIASFLARAISSFFNYLINKNAVFKNNKDPKTIFNYYFLVIINITLSSLLVSQISTYLKIFPTIIKGIIDIFIFIANYFIQKNIIFNKNKKDNNIIRLFLAIFTFVLFFLKLNKSEIFFNYTWYESIQLIIYLALFLIYYLRFFKFNEGTKSLKILSLFFTIFTIVGYSYLQVGTFELIYLNEFFILLTVLKVYFFYIFFQSILSKTYNYLINFKFKKEPVTKLILIFNKHPYLFTFITLTILFLPVLLAFFPGMINNDNAQQIREIMGFKSRYIDDVFLINSSITITNFNPVLHTLLIGGLFKIGYTLISANFGILLYTLFQELIVISVLSYTIYYLKKEGINNKYLWLMILMYAIIPIFSFYAMTGVKDVLYSMILILYIIKLYDIIKHPQKIINYIYFTIIIILFILLRNNGIYTILLSLPFLLLLKKDRKIIVLVLCFSFIFYYSYNKVLLPALNIPNTSIREVLSVPFQQTARYVKYYENEVTEKEKKAIEKVLEYDTLKSSYNDRLSDPVKDKFNKNATNEELKNYFQVWFQMLLKKPNVYIQATMNNTFAYYYPDTYRWYIYTAQNKILWENDLDYKFINSLEPFRNFFTGYGAVYHYLPIINLTVSCGFYTWLYMFFAALLLIQKKKKYLILLAPAFSLILMCFVGPANTYFRYVLPYALSAPLILGLILMNINNNITKKTKNTQTKKEIAKVEII